MCNSGITAYIIQQYEHDMADVAAHVRLLSTCKAHDVQAVPISTIQHSIIKHNYVFLIA